MVVIQRFLHCPQAAQAACGGKILMNLGPMGNGTIDPKDVAILPGIAEWWQTNNELIRGATATPLPVQTGGESTRKGKMIYLPVLHWPSSGKLVVGGLNPKSEIGRADLP